MANSKTIEIDLDVYKQIKAARLSFAETPNDVLRRLLQIEVASPIPTARTWSRDGVALLDGTELRMEYGGKVFFGYIANGRWLVEGKNFDSPSSAAGIAKTRDGSTPSLNGWIYWQVRRPGDRDWVLIDTLRKTAPVPSLEDLLGGLQSASTTKPSQPN